MEEGKDIVLFDGFCNFCSASVLFIIRRDPSGKFIFSPSQSDEGKNLLNKHSIGDLATHSIILIRDQKIYEKSDAALRIAQQLRGAWPLIYGFIILPGFIRDFFYDLLAQNRYRFYGSREKCFLPDSTMRNRFLSAE